VPLLDPPPPEGSVFAVIPGMIVLMFPIVVSSHPVFIVVVQEFGRLNLVLLKIADGPETRRQKQRRTYQK
jgi:hypothetical protein